METKGVLELRGGNGKSIHSTNGLALVTRKNKLLETRGKPKTK